MRRQIVRVAQGVSVLGLSKGNLEKLTLGLPAYEEQEKIAAILMAVDAKIDAVTGQIAHMETFKKGLLQKTFV
jgi:type I restriction enzyme S subunit